MCCCLQSLILYAAAEKFNLTLVNVDAVEDIEHQMNQSSWSQIINLFANNVLNNLQILEKTEL